MSKKIVFSIAEAPGFPNLSSLYKKLNIDEQFFNATRKAMTALKKCSPDIIIAEFIYGYGSNYAGVNISNLDVFLYSLQKYSPNAKKIIFVKKHERKFVDKLNDIILLDAILTYPIDSLNLEKILEELIN
ncbi:hypothetical protein MNBD_GAMMA22-1746 [hydrothermal vent metagenome]|uniref:Uncharacterized protein n=1 Tax=hydrothermal vent metagenome TaxID=652676 RepID=A0A3B1A4K6_9ZZZZ